MSTVALSLPDPQSVALASLPDVLEQAALIRAHCGESGDSETAHELWMRLRAFATYIADRDARRALEAESRLAEVLIGELLGPAEMGPAGGSFQLGKTLAPADRNRFRLLAEHRPLVEQLLARGVTKRKALLDAIREAERLDAPADEPTVPGTLRDTYSTLVIDPPWRYGNAATRGAAEDHYPTMSIEDLMELPAICPQIADSVDSHIYLWTTTSFLREAFDLLAAWGYTYKTNLVWVKPQIGMGNYFRVSHEHILFGVRGKCGPTLNDNTPTWFQAPRERHSKKPDVFYELVERSSPGPYLDIFSRPRQERLGSAQWDAWGNEA